VQSKQAQSNQTLNGYAVDKNDLAEIYKIMYSCSMKVLKFLGNALDDLRNFPESARR